MIESLPRFEQVKHLTWLRQKNSYCLKWEYKRYLADLRRNPNVYVIEHDPPAPGMARDDDVSVVVYMLKDRETELDCPPYSQRIEDWHERLNRPAEAVKIQALLERAR